MASNIDPFAEEAAKLTFVFHKTAKGQFRNIFEPENIIAESNKVAKWDDLVSLYKTWIKGNSDKNLSLPSEELEKNKYFNLIYARADRSFDNTHNRFVNPLTQTIVSLSSSNEFQDRVKSVIYDEIKNFLENKLSLPSVYEEDESGWLRTVTALYAVADQKKLLKTDFSPIKEEKPLEPNYTVSVKDNKSETSVEMVYENDEQKIFLRQTFKGNVPMQVKPYDILKMRDYLRIIRRLWNLSRLHDNKEITTFNEKREVNNHPYFKKHRNQTHIYTRINKLQK